MTKSELKAGYTLEDELCRHWYLFQTQDELRGVLIKDNKIEIYTELNLNEGLNEDLTSRSKSYNPSCDIVKVYGYTKHLFVLFEGRLDYCELLWQREQPKKSITLELTDEQIESLKKQGII